MRFLPVVPLYVALFCYPLPVLYLRMPRVVRGALFCTLPHSPRALPVRYCRSVGGDAYHHLLVPFVTSHFVAYLRASYHRTARTTFCAAALPYATHYTFCTLPFALRLMLFARWIPLPCLPYAVCALPLPRAPSRGRYARTHLPPAHFLSLPFFPHCLHHSPLVCYFSCPFCCPLPVRCHHLFCFILRCTSRKFLHIALALTLLLWDFMVPRRPVP